MRRCGTKVIACFERVLLLLALAVSVSCARVSELEAWLLPSDVQELNVISPRGARLLEQAEMARRAREDERAVELYRKAAAELPNRDLPRRFECLLQSERGRQAEALVACQQATYARNTEAARRALAGALIAGKARPTSDELAKAYDIAKPLLAVSRQSPFGYAVLCDIARSIGDDEMLSQNLAKLREVAPEHYETRRLNRLAGSSALPVSFYVGWTLLAALLLTTALHAAWRVFFGRARQSLSEASKPRVTAAVMGTTATVLFALAVTLPAQADEPKLSYGLSEWGINDEDPESTIPSLDMRNRNPLQAGYHLMDLAEKVEKAEKAGEHARAVKYLRALAKMVPERSLAFGKLCAAYEALGETQKATQMCSAALTKPGVRVEDYVRFSRLVMNEADGLTPQEVTDLGQMIAHLRAEPAGVLAAAQIECDLGFRLNDEKRLVDCTTALKQLAPQDPKTVSYEWTLALMQEDFGRARELIETAQKLGVPSDVVDKMRMATQMALPWYRRPRTAIPAALSVVLAGALGVFLLRRRPSSRRAQAASGEARSPA